MAQLQPLAEKLLAWYYQNRRILPFREDPTPYHIWVSEIMLQQTRVNAALPYYERFIAELPDVASLAACEEERLHKLWEGLGYYSRVRNMQKAAQIVMREYGGRLPADYEKLLALPGIGEYTAGAIASIAFGLPAIAVDGNVLRVFARLTANPGDVMLPAVKKELSAEVRKQQPKEAPGDYNQAIMELGALVCLPGAPACGGCPLAGLCQGFRQGTAAQLPYKAPKKPKKEIPVCLLGALTEDGKILLHKRPAKGLLAGLWEPFLLEGSFTREQALAELRKLIPKADATLALPSSSHIFTHKIWNMYGWLCPVPASDKIRHLLASQEYILATRQQLEEQYALPGAFHVFRSFMMSLPV